MKKFWYAFLLLAVGLVSCNKTDDLWDEVDDFKNRVTALETQIKDLNWNIEALRELAKEGATITGVEEKDGSYKITMSDGKILNLVQQTDATNLLPVVGIDAEGYWMVSYNGETPSRIKDSNGNDVMAKGENGATPKFSVDAEGYWMVQYGSGAPEYVKDVDGNKVKATGGTGGASDTFFDTVEKRANELYIKLKTGEEMIIPIVSNFSCVIDAPAGIQSFTAGEIKSFNVTMKGVENTMVTAPSGWKADVSKDTSKPEDATAYILKVTAPAAPATFSTRASADNSKDVAILATSGAYACIAKIQVEVLEPVVTINYLTEYTNDRDFDISGFTINRTLYGDAAVVTANEGETVDIAEYINKTKVIFLSGTGTFTLSARTTITETAIIIGSEADKEYILKPASGAYFITGKNEFMLKNVHVDSSASTYFSNNSKNDSQRYAIDDCKFTGLTAGILYASTAPANGISQIRITNSSIMGNKNGWSLLSIQNATNLNAYTELVFTNNIVHNAFSGGKVQLFQWVETAVPTTDGSLMNATITNNTFINVIAGNQFVKFYTANSLTMKKNIFASKHTAAVSNSFLYCFYKADAQPNVDVTDNIIYDVVNKWYSYPDNSTYPAEKPSGANLLERVENDPVPNIATGDYTPISEYTGYGASLK